VLHEGTQSGLKRPGEGNHQAKHSDAATERHLIQLRQDKAELKHELSFARVRRPLYDFLGGLVCVNLHVKSDLQFVFSVLRVYSYIDRILLHSGLWFVSRNPVYTLLMASRALIRLLPSTLSSCFPFFLSPSCPSGILASLPTHTFRALLS
jgi:hypothetical protein